MSECKDNILLIGGLIDGELDAANALAIEAHLRDCKTCAAEYERNMALRQRLAGAAFVAPETLRARLPNHSVSKPTARLRSPFGGYAAGVATALAASLALFVALPQLSTGGLQDDLVASHIESLLPGHLIDVATSNRHVVKPWFNGKIDFSPPVIDLSDRGFPLVGARLDYVGGRVVPVLVYRRNLHMINLFIRRSATLSSPLQATARRDGYTLVRWTDGGLEYWAVSDVQRDDLSAFHSAFSDRAAQRP